MARSVVALVTGYSKVAFLNQISFEQLRKLRRAGVLDRIVYVTWDSARLDPIFEPFAAMPDVEVVRVPEPPIQGAPLQKSIIYQIRNLEAALRCVDDPDALILKTRPDFVFMNEGFIAQKIRDFETWSAPSTMAAQLKVDAPPPVFDRKVWVPWASASEPLFISDAVYLGLRRDIDKLADQAAEPFLEILWDERCDRISHISRYLNIFQEPYPILRRFGENIRYFVSTLDYRDYFAFICRNQPFFWCLALVNAWLLETHFHIDGGHNSDLIFCSNHANQYEKLTSVRDLKFEPPLTAIDQWRKNMRPGSLKVSCDYSVTVLASDEWQHALFTRSMIDDTPHAEIVALLRQAIAYDREKIGAIEDAFYAAAERYYQKYIAENPGVLSPLGVIEHASRSRRVVEARMAAERAKKD